MPASTNNHPGPVPDETHSTPDAVSPSPPDMAAAPPEPALTHPPARATEAGMPPAIRQPAATGADAANYTGALSSMQQVVELADRMVHIADQLHERIVQEILSYNGTTMPDAEQATMRILMDDELLLRQRAQAMYADAATFVLHGLAQPQRRLLALAAVAAENIRHIGVIGEATGLVGGILSLAGGIATGQSVLVEAALEQIQLRNAALKALKPARPAKT